LGRTEGSFAALVDIVVFLQHRIP